MKTDNIKLLNGNMYGNSRGKIRMKGENIQDESRIKVYRPAERVSSSGSEHLRDKNQDTIAFKGDPKLLTGIVREFVDKGASPKISEAAKKMGGAVWFDKVLKNVDKNEAFYEAAVALVVAGLLKPICVLAMPGAEREDKEMAATKNAVSAFTGFTLSTLLLSPVSAAVNKITKSFNSSDPLKYIKDKDYISALQSEDLLLGRKSTLGDSFKSTYKKMADIGISPMKAAITMTIVPFVVKAIFGNKKKNKNKQENVNPLNDMVVMNAIRMDGTKKKDAPAPIAANSLAPSFKGNSNNNQVSFKGGINPIIDITKSAAEKAAHKGIFSRAKEAYSSFLAEPIAKGIGKISTTKPAKWLVDLFAHFEKPSARWSDLASFAITYFYVNNTRKSETMDEDRKLPLMINNVMVTAASSTTAFLLDKFTDKPMENLLRGYLNAHDADLMNKANITIKKNLKTALENGKDAVDLDAMKRHSGDLIQNGVENLSDNMKSAIKVLQNDDVIKQAIKEKIISSEDISKLAVSGFEQQASKIFKNISKAKSLTIFTITVRFLVTVLMTPVIGKVVAMVNKKLGKTQDDSKTTNPNAPLAGSETLGIKDYINSLNK